MDNFKLGDDLSLCDNILDPVTFDDIVTAVRLNEKVVDKDAVLKTARELIDIRMRDHQRRAFLQGRCCVISSLNQNQKNKKGVGKPALLLCAQGFCHMYDRLLII